MKKLIILALVIAACSQPKKSDVSKYPVTEKGNVVDTLFGVPVADPYRWLENDTTQQTANWVTAQNDVTFGYLKNIPFRDAIRKRLDEVQNYERLSAPYREGDYIYYSKNSGLQNHNVQYRKKGENGAEEVFLDPNTFSKDGTTALG
ncbi:MAG: S9 family peptidase, partial [Bacteroidota bacterium]